MPTNYPGHQKMIFKITISLRYFLDFKTYITRSYECFLHCTYTSMTFLIKILYLCEIFGFQGLLSVIPVSCTERFYRKLENSGTVSVLGKNIHPCLIPIAAAGISGIKLQLVWCQVVHRRGEAGLSLFPRLDLGRGHY